MLKMTKSGWKYTFFVASLWWESITTNDDIYNILPEALWEMLSDITN